VIPVAEDGDLGRIVEDLSALHLSQGNEEPERVGMNPSQQPPSQADIATLNVRMTNAEKDIDVMQKQLQSYVSQQVSDLQFKGMQQTLDRIERDQQDSKKTQNEQLMTMNTKIDNLKTKGLERTVNIFVGIGVGVLVTIIGTGLIYFFTHIGG
jgi:hypothetical protein